MTDMQNLGTFIADKINRLGQFVDLQNGAASAAGDNVITITVPLYYEGNSLGFTRRSGEETTTSFFYDVAEDWRIKGFDVIVRGYSPYQLLIYVDMSDFTNDKLTIGDGLLVDGTKGAYELRYVGWCYLYANGELKVEA